MFTYLASFVFSFFKHKEVRDKVIQAIENGDNVAHTQDAFKAVTLSFAIVFGWADADILLAWAMYPEQNLLPHVGFFTVIFGGALGVSFK